MHVAIIGSGISSLSTIHYFNRNIKIDLYGFENKNLWLSNPELNFFIHRSFSIFILISNFLLFYLAKKLNTNTKWITIILVLIFSEIIAGASMYYFSFPLLSQPLHLLIAILIFGAQFFWFLTIELSLIHI